MALPALPLHNLKLWESYDNKPEIITLIYRQGFVKLIDQNLIDVVPLL